jgi:hypothetical protein
MPYSPGRKDRGFSDRFDLSILFAFIDDVGRHASWNSDHIFAKYLGKHAAAGRIIGARLSDAGAVPAKNYRYYPSFKVNKSSPRRSVTSALAMVYYIGGARILRD